MDCSRALSELGVADGTLSHAQREQLDRDGYVVFEGLMDRVWLEALRHRLEELFEREGASAGVEVHQEVGARRLSDLVNKGEVFDGIYTHPAVLAAVSHVIARPFKLSSLNARDALRGQGLQALHADWGARSVDEPFHVVNSLWLLDDYTGKNGSTRVVPGTHRWAGTVAGYCNASWPSPEADHPDQLVLRAPAGSVVVINSHVWHGGTLNISGETRRVCHGYFVGREHRQQLDQGEYVRKRTWDRISPAARWVLDV